MASLVARSVALNARRGVQVTSVRFANKKRFMKAVPVKGTQQYHRFVPVEPFGTLQVFKVSTEQMGRLVSCLKSDDKLEDDFVVEEGELVVVMADPWSMPQDWINRNCLPRLQEMT
ncbi:hypothetical protein GWK47_043733 [Chionoecetes opilio]|uniref:Uncharacterized protein n=1 Tax=Chionoecetes opilio TaxID=41210 RepID=A0A8J5CJ62_CHIOP|nr:hypothetical protein GWK47_043733 [Chionoecetes opilio]